MIGELVRAAVGAALLTLGLAGVACAQRAEVPINLVVLSDGTPRFTIPVTIGSKTIIAGFDTGSTGLRVMPGVLGPSDATETRQIAEYYFLSGTSLTGPIALGNVVIGGLAHEMGLQAVRQVTCIRRTPFCPALHIAVADFGIEGDGLKGEGFKALIGVDLGEAGASNPLRALGVNQWIVDLPTPGSDKPGRLVLNPTPEEMAGYVKLRLDPRLAKSTRGAHDAVQGCLTDLSTRHKMCAPVYLDSGTPGIQIINRTIDSWTPDAPGMLELIDNGKPVASARFESNQRRQASHVNVILNPNADMPVIGAGILPYFAWSVLYDADQSMLGFKARTDGTVPTMTPTN